MHLPRILTALVGVPILFLIIKCSPSVFAAFLALSLAVAAFEYSRLLERIGLVSFKVLTLVCALAIFFAMFLEIDFKLTATICLFAFFVTAFLGRGQTAFDKIFLSSSASFFGAFMLGAMLGYQALLRDISDKPVFLLYLAVWLGDIGALYAGRTLGRRFITPHLSPKKTFEGCAANVVFAVVGALIAKWWFLPALSLPDAFAIGIILGVTGQLGDLAISFVKRAANAKDAGVIFPGHGGLLDRADSLLFSAPALYAYWTFVLS